MQWQYWQFFLSDIRSIELSLEKEPSEKVKTSLYSASIYQRRHQSNGRQIGRFAAPFSCRSSHWEIFLMQIITTEDLSYANPTHNRPTTYNVLKSSKLTFKTKRFDLRPEFIFTDFQMSGRYMSSIFMQ